MRSSVLGGSMSRREEGEGVGSRQEGVELRRAGVFVLQRSRQCFRSTPRRRVHVVPALGDRTSGEWGHRFTMTTGIMSLPV